MAGGGGFSLLGLGITWSLLPGKIRTQTEGNQPLKKMHPMGIFPLGPSAAESRQTPGAISPADADSEQFRKDPTIGGED